MSENNVISTSDYRNMVSTMGKKEFTFLKMQEYGFWPQDLPSPFDKQKNESPEDFERRNQLVKDYQKLITQINKLYQDKNELMTKLNEFKKQLKYTYNPERIRKDIAQMIFQESLKRRAEKKAAREAARIKKTEDWKIKKANEIVTIGKKYSNKLKEKETDIEKLQKNNLPIITTEKELAEFLKLEYKDLRFLCYHREVVINDHYHRYQIPKRKGGMRNIAAPKPLLKNSQRIILSEILNKLKISEFAHGFIPGKSIVSGASSHTMKPELVINMDLENFFPTITFHRVLGLFHALGYSGFISSLISMICTYCERMPIEIKGVTKYVATSERILPQGSPASPMITNILCGSLDRRLNGLSNKFGFKYSRYADDLSFSLEKLDNVNVGRFSGLVSQIITDEGLKVNKEKTRFLKKNNRQEITGIVINNSELAVPKKWVKNFRAAIYNAKKAKESGELTFDKRNELKGMASWLNSVNKSKYQKMIDSAFLLAKE